MAEISSPNGMKSRLEITVPLESVITLGEPKVSFVKYLVTGEVGVAVATVCSRIKKKSDKSVFNKTECQPFNNLKSSPEFSKSEKEKKIVKVLLGETILKYEAKY